MIYDAFTSLLLSMLETEEHNSTNTLIARYLLAHAGDSNRLSVKEVAEACHVGTGTVSRFTRDAGFESFAALKEAFTSFDQSFSLVDGPTPAARSTNLSAAIAQALEHVQRTLDTQALQRLAADLVAYDNVLVVGLLKGQAAALNMQVDLLMLGKATDTCSSYAEQVKRIRTARNDTLVVVFSHTASYFDACDLGPALKRLDRPKIWMVCGANRPIPAFIADRLLFDSGAFPFGHPYQLQYVAGLIAQEYATLAKTNR